MNFESPCENLSSTKLTIWRNVIPVGSLTKVERVCSWWKSNFAILSWSDCVLFVRATAVARLKCGNMRSSYKIAPFLFGMTSYCSLSLYYIILVEFPKKSSLKKLKRINKCRGNVLHPLPHSLPIFILSYFKQNLWCIFFFLQFLSLSSSCLLPDFFLEKIFQTF